MKKSTFLFSFFVGATLVSAGLYAAEGQTTPNNEDSKASSEPIYIASAQAGTNVGSSNTSILYHLPGMNTPLQPALPATAVHTPARALPIEILSDVTNYPNPFDSRKGGLDGQTIIAYRLTQDAHTTITMYTLLGSKVRTWEFHPGDNGGRQGINTIPWDGTNEAGQKVSKGGYLAQIEVAAADGTFASVYRKIGVIH